MLVAAVIGGYLGTVLAGRVPSTMLRRFVIVFGVIMMAVLLGRGMVGVGLSRLKHRYGQPAPSKQGAMDKGSTT